MGNNQLLSTLIYFSLFNFPPTREELWYFLHGENGKKFTKKEFEIRLKDIQQGNGFYFLKGHKKYIALRQKRQTAGIKKLQRAKLIGSLVAYLLTVKFIGITGGLAMQNADRDDDIDFFIVTTSKTIWITRLLSSIMLDILGLRRRRADRKVANKVCLNMFVDERVLSVPKERRDIYTAHEFVQMIPIYNKDKTYQKLLKKNSWLESFLPNAHIYYKKYTPKNASTGIFSAIITILIRVFLVEYIVKYVQLKYMRIPKKETVTDTMLAFHPFDYRRAILIKYKRRLQNYGVI